MWETVFCCLGFILGASRADDYYDCINPAKDCGRTIELFSGDSLTLSTRDRDTHNALDHRTYKDRVIIARQRDLPYGACIGCTLTVNFTEYYSKSTTMTLMEGNYTSSEYNLSNLAVFGAESGKQPTKVNTTGNVLQILFDGPSLDSRIQIYITTNIPTENHNMGPLIGISAVVTTIILASYAIGLRIRHRRLARMGVDVEGRVSPLVLDSALNAAMLRHSHRQRRQAPHSPDPTDSVAPPSYEEAAPPPPKYEDIVTEANDTTPPAEPNSPEQEGAVATSDAVDSAGPDNGQDTDMLVI